MTLFERVHLPSFAGTTEWLNSEPLGAAELRGSTPPSATERWRSAFLQPAAEAYSFTFG